MRTIGDPFTNIGEAILAPLVTATVTGPVGYSCYQDYRNGDVHIGRLTFLGVTLGVTSWLLNNSYCFFTENKMDLMGLTLTEIQF